MSGFKAGALRIAMEHTAPDAEIIGVIDSDYVVHPDWLKDLVPVFEDPTVGLVQAPQDHRDAHLSPMHEAMNAEYAGFLHIGMVQRNEEDAIVVHGTMCLIRRAAMMEAGGWSSDTICEEPISACPSRRMAGRPLYPPSLWLGPAAGHVRSLQEAASPLGLWRLPDHQEALAPVLPGASRLTTAQRRHFLLGWATWLGAEAIGAVAAVLSLAFVPFVLALGIAVPAYVLTCPS